jgi:hypothetical protein
MLGSLIPAPPLYGAGAALETDVLKDRVAAFETRLSFVWRSLAICTFAEPIRNRCFLGPTLEILMNFKEGQIAALQAGRIVGLCHATSGPPERLAGLRKGVFACDSNVIQQPVVKFAQVLPAPPTN